MSQLPTDFASSEQQQIILKQMYQLMDMQVKSYHKQRHLGNNSSVSMELAQELMESVEYTVNQAGGLCMHRNAENALRMGQEILRNKHDKAEKLLKLVEGTAPRWQTECRWEALKCLQGYLNSYDFLHLAHKGPDAFFYPILIATPEDVRGIDLCLFYLHILWIENQIMAGISESALEAFWDHLPAGTCNPCDHVLMNGLGKVLLRADLKALTFAPQDYVSLVEAMLCADGKALENAAKTLCQWLALKDENARLYVRAVVPLLSRWTGNAILNADVETLFL